MKKNKIIAVSFGGFKNYNIKKYINLFTLIFCSIVGVGFISGGEIVQFFVRFGNLCYIGIVVFFIMVYSVIYKILVKNIDKNLQTQSIINKKHKNNQDEKQINLSKKNSKYNKNNKKKINIFILKSSNLKQKIYETVIFFNVFIIASAMFSGMNYFIKNLYNNNYYILFFCSIIIIFVVFLRGIKWLKKVDLFVIIFAIFIVICLIISITKTPNLLEKIGLKKAIQVEKFDSNLHIISEVSGSKKVNFDAIKKLILAVIFPIFYVFMNMFQVQPLVNSSGDFLKTKKQCKIFAFIFSFLLSFMLLIFAIFLIINFDLTIFSMPFLEYFKSKSDIIKSVFCFGLLIALITTLVSCLIGVKKYILEKVDFNHLIVTILVFCLTLIFGFIPFNFYVSVAYPVLGLLNFLIFVFY